MSSPLPPLLPAIRREIFPPQQRLRLLKSHMRTTGHAFWNDLQEHFRLTGRSFTSRKVTHVHFEGSAVSDREVIAVLQTLPLAINIYLQNSRITQEALLALRRDYPDLTMISSADYLLISPTSNPSPSNPPISFLEFEEKQRRIERTRQASFQDLEEYLSITKMRFQNRNPLSLDLSKGRITDEELEKILRDFPNLESLSLNRHITERGFRYLTRALFLRKIDLASSPVTPQIALHLAENCARLEELNLSGSSISTEDVHTIKRLCPRIKTLILERCERVDHAEIGRIYPTLRIANPTTSILPRLHRITRILGDLTWPPSLRNQPRRRFLSLSQSQ